VRSQASPNAWAFESPEPRWLFPSHLGSRGLDSLAVTRARGGGVVVTVLVLAAALWTRLAPWNAVFTEGEVVPFDPDCNYHIERMIETARRFPAWPRFDPYLDWPNGAATPWPGGFDQLGALLILASGAGGDPKRAAHAAAWLPVILGLATVLLTMHLARKLARGRDDPEAPRPALVAALAGALIAILPNAVAVSWLGAVDHHVAEVAVVLLLLLWVLARPDRSTDHAGARRAALRFEALGAGLIAGAVHVFNGSVVYVAAATALLMARQLLEPRARWMGSGGTALASAAALVALLFWPAVSVHGRPFDYHFASFLHALLLAGAAAGVFATWLAAHLVPQDVLEGRTLLRRAAIAAGALAIAGALAFAASPAAFVPVASGFSDWLGRGLEFMQSIDESRPLIQGSPFDPSAWALVEKLFGIAGLTLVVTFPLSAARALRVDPARGACFFFYALFFFALALLQARFARLAAPFVAISAAFAIEAAAARTKKVSRPIAAALIAGALILADGRLQLYLVPLPPLKLDAVSDAARFLRDSTPPVAPRSRSGVLAPWSAGFIIRQLGQRPVLLTGHGPYLSAETFARAERAWRGSEAELDAWLEARDVGFIVAGISFFARLRGPDGEPLRLELDRRPEVRYFAGVPLGVMAIGGSAVPEIGVHHLEHWMPVFASSAKAAAVDPPLPELFVFERVEGAEIRADCEASSRVTAELAIEVREEKLRYLAFADARDGACALRLALPSGFASGAIRTGAAYALERSDHAVAEIEVPEADVRAGRSIAVRLSAAGP
jgi:asparagine N-glycosylation enzyme membrane subunit Stt3